MKYENWLHISSLDVGTQFCEPVKGNIKTDFLVVGGGFAGLHAALKLVDSGKKVILIEKSICGAGSSGQSGGFLTPESEEDMRQIAISYGKEKAEALYEIPLKGVKLIVDTAKRYGFNCDLRKQDSFYFSENNFDVKYIDEEAKYKKEEGFPYELYEKNKIKGILPGKNYIKGMRYPGSYGINSFAYCQELKKTLMKKGVKVFEATEVKSIEGNTAKTHLGSVTAKTIIMCVDKLKEEISQELSDEYYHMQTYLAVSEPLSEKEMKSVFPKEELMCWNTKLIYIHYRVVSGNRIIVGGSSPWATYYPKYLHSPRPIKPFIKNLKENFPTLKNVEFPYYWSGLIDVTKDLVPIVDYDSRNKSIQYVMGCAGLNWAAYCGTYAAERAINSKMKDNLKEFLSSRRRFFISGKLQRFLGKRISFALSHIKKLMT